jgi:hypothetical protein
MGKPTEPPQVSVTDTADIKVLSAWGCLVLMCVTDQNRESSGWVASVLMNFADRME